MSCPFTKDHGKDFMKNLGIVTKDGKCPARECPVLKDYVAKKESDEKCPFLQNHNCPLFANMMKNYKKE